MLFAVRSVQDGKGLREAARMHNVPVETLRRPVIGVVDIFCKPGPPTILTPEEESALEKHIVTMAELGFGLTRDDVIRLAFSIVEKSGRQHPFKDGKAGQEWFDAFRARHPHLTLRTPQPLSYCRV